MHVYTNAHVIFLFLVNTHVYLRKWRYVFTKTRKSFLCQNMYLFTYIGVPVYTNAHVILDPLMVQHMSELMRLLFDSAVAWQSVVSHQQSGRLVHGLQGGATPNQHAPALWHEDQPMASNDWHAPKEGLRHSAKRGAGQGHHLRGAV